jgi:hypothetical protein
MWREIGGNGGLAWVLDSWSGRHTGIGLEWEEAKGAVLIAVSY